MSVNNKMNVDNNEAEAKLKIVNINIYYRYNIKQIIMI